MRKNTMEKGISPNNLRPPLTPEQILNIFHIEVYPLFREIRAALNQTLSLVRDVRTTDATATTIFSETVQPGTGLDVDIAVSGMSTVGDYAAYRRLTRIRRTGSAAPSILGTDTLGTDREDIAGWNLTVTTTGNKLLIEVTGSAGKTVDWVVRLTIQEAPRPKLPAAT